MSGGRFVSSKKLIIVEMIVYAAVLVWFLYTFIPVGLK